MAGFLAAFSASELLTSLLAIFEELILLAALRADSGALRACANPYFVNNYHRNHIPMPNLVISVNIKICMVGLVRLIII